MTAQTKRIYEFGPFRIDDGERVLLRNGRPESLPPKAFDVLLMLVESSGHIVEKDDLMNRVWADSFVEEANLKVTVSVLRKALDQDAGEQQYIETVPRRGYRFMADVRELSDQPPGLILLERTRAELLIEETEERTGKEDGQFARLAPHATLSWQARFVYLLSGGLILMLLVAGGAFWFFRNHTRGSIASLSPQKTTLRRFSAHGGVPFRVAISPDGKTLVYWQRIKGEHSLWLGQIETNSSVPLSMNSQASCLTISSLHAMAAASTST